MEPPVKPDESDCCNSGCNPCILDVYEEQLKKYNTSNQGAQNPTINCLSSTSYTIFKLVKAEQHTKDCYFYTFEYVRPKFCLGHTDISPEKASVVYEPGQYFLLRATILGETFQKAYTPLFQENQFSNQFTILVKLYKNGQMSRYFRQITIGKETLWRGPYGDYIVSYNYKHMLFIAQGTGIAPFFTIICHMLQNPDCFTFITLYFCCNADNVLLRDSLYKLREHWNFKYELFISNACEEIFASKYEETLNYSRLGEEDIGRFLKKDKGDLRVLVCGAESFCDNVKNMLVRCSVPNEDIIIF